MSRITVVNPWFASTSDCISLARLLCIGIASLLLSISAHAQTKPAEFNGLYEREPLRATPPAKASDSPTTQISQAAFRSSGNSVSPARVLLALGLVLSLIFTLRWAGRKYFPAVAGGRSLGAVRVLSRSPVAPKQQVLLLHVGRRVLVVADNGQQLNALSVITEPDEVAHLVGQHSSSATPGVFESAFGKAQDNFEETTASASTTADATEEVATNDEDAADQESIASAQGDLKGLMDKVRGLAEQLGRST